MKKNKHQDAYKAFKEYGTRCAENSSVSIARTWVSTTKGELSDISKQVFMAALAEPPKASNLKTFKQLEEELKGLKSRADFVQHEKRKLEEAITKAEASKKSNDVTLAWAMGLVVAASAASVAVPVVAPFVGPVGTAALVMLQEELGEQNKQLSILIAETKDKREKLPQNTQSLIQTLKEEVTKLFKALTGVDHAGEL